MDSSFLSVSTAPSTFCGMECTTVSSGKILRQWFLQPKRANSYRVRLMGYDNSVPKDSEFQQLVTTGVIKQRVDWKSVRTGSGSVYQLEGPMAVDKMRKNGYGERIIENFSIGFPLEWKSFLRADFERKILDSSSSKMASKKQLTEPVSAGVSVVPAPQHAPFLEQVEEPIFKVPLPLRRRKATPMDLTQEFSTVETPQKTSGKQSAVPDPDSQLSFEIPLRPEVRSIMPTKSTKGKRTRLLPRDESSVAESDITVNSSRYCLRRRDLNVSYLPVAVITPRAKKKDESRKTGLTQILTDISNLSLNETCHTVPANKKRKPRSKPQTLEESAVVPDVVVLPAGKSRRAKPQKFQSNLDAIPELVVPLTNNPANQKLKGKHSKRLQGDFTLIPTGNSTVLPASTECRGPMTRSRAALLNGLSSTTSESCQKTANVLRKSITKAKSSWKSAAPDGTVPLNASVGTANRTRTQKDKKNPAAEKKTATKKPESPLADKSAKSAVRRVSMKKSQPIKRSSPATGRKQARRTRTRASKRKMDDTNFLISPAPKRKSLRPATKTRKSMLANKPPASQKKQDVVKPMKRRNVNWFKNVVENVTRVSTGKKTAANIMFPPTSSALRGVSSLPQADWNMDEELDDYVPLTFTDTTRTFRLSAGKKKTNSGDKRNIFQPSNSQMAVDRLNFQGFLQAEKKQAVKNPRKIDITFPKWNNRGGFPASSLNIPRLPKELQNADGIDVEED